MDLERLERNHRKTDSHMYFKQPNMHMPSDKLSTNRRICTANNLEMVPKQNKHSGDQRSFFFSGQLKGLLMSLVR